MSKVEFFRRQLVIRCYYPFTPNKKIADALGMTASHVQVMAFRMGLKKDPEYISMINRANGKKGLVARRLAHHD